MGETQITDQQAGFASGLCQTTAPGDPFGWPGNPDTVVRPDQALRLDNCRITVSGQATKRLGTLRTMPLANILTVPVAGIFYEYANAIVLDCQGAGLYSGDASSGIPNTYTHITSSVGGSSVFPSVFAEFSDVTGITTPVLYQANVNSGLGKWNGTTYSQPASVPAVTGICVYNQRLWGWISGSSNALYYSNLSSAAGSIGGDSLGVGASGGGQINVQTFGQSNIICCCVVGSSLMIFHQHGVSRLTGFGQSDISVQPQPVSTSVRIVGPQACAVYESVAFVATVQGVYAVSEGGVQRLGTAEKPDPTIFPVIVSLTQGSPSRINVAYNESTNELWVDTHLSASAYAGTYVYNTVLGAWYGPWNGRFANLNGFVNYPGYASAGNNPQLLILDTVGYVLRSEYSTLLDDITYTGTGGSTYTQVIRPHRMYGLQVFGQPNSKSFSKTWQWANVMAEMTAGAAAPVVVQSSALGTPSTTTFGTLVSASSVYYQPGGPYGAYVDITITDTSSGQSSYSGITVIGKLLGQR